MILACHLAPLDPVSTLHAAINKGDGKAGVSDISAAIYKIARGLRSWLAPKELSARRIALRATPIGVSLA